TTLGYVANDEKVRIGERVFTSGEDRIYPKGLPVGVIVEAKPGPGFQDISVQPFAKLDRLEEVLVVTKKVDVEFSEPPVPSPATASVASATAEIPRSPAQPRQEALVTPPPPQPRQNPTANVPSGNSTPANP